MTRRRGDFTAIVEALYDLEREESSWLEGIADAIVPTLDRGLGSWAMVYEASAPGRARIHRLVHVGSTSAVACGAVVRAITRGADVCAAPSCALVSEIVPRGERAALETLRAFHIADAFAIHGANPFGAGILFGVNLPRRARIADASRARWTRVAAHLAAAYRLRQRLEDSRLAPASRVDAVLEPGGRLVEAASGASSLGARRTLREATVAIDRARGRLRHKADAALSAWKGLVAARWTLLDRFDRDGRRYVIARANEPVTPCIEVLSERERQAAAFACLGHSNKLIAYELGLATSTVGVLLSRAMAKLGVRGRKELIAALRAIA